MAAFALAPSVTRSATNSVVTEMLNKQAPDFYGKDFKFLHNSGSEKDFSKNTFMFLQTNLVHKGLTKATKVPWHVQSHKRQLPPAAVLFVILSAFKSTHTTVNYLIWPLGDAAVILF